MNILLAIIVGGLIGIIPVLLIKDKIGDELPSQRNKRVKKMFTDAGLDVDVKVAYAIPEREEMYVWVSTEYKKHHISDCFPYVELDNNKVLEIRQKFEERMAKYEYSISNPCSQCGGQHGDTQLFKTATCTGFGYKTISNINGTPLCSACK